MDFESIEEFGEYLLDNDRTTFMFAEAEQIAIALGQSVPTLVIRELKSYGLSMEARQPERQVRGFRANSHDRWTGKGSCATHGGSGWEQISGFAGQEG